MLSTTLAALVSRASFVTTISTSGMSLLDEPGGFSALGSWIDISWPSSSEVFSRISKEADGITGSLSVPFFSGVASTTETSPTNPDVSTNTFLGSFSVVSSVWGLISLSDGCSLEGSSGAICSTALRLSSFGCSPTDMANSDSLFTDDLELESTVVCSSASSGLPPGDLPSESCFAWTVGKANSESSKTGAFNGSSAFFSSLGFTSLVCSKSVPTFWFWSLSPISFVTSCGVGNWLSPWEHTDGGGAGLFTTGSLVLSSFLLSSFLRKMALADIRCLASGLVLILIGAADVGGGATGFCLIGDAFFWGKIGLFGAALVSPTPCSLAVCSPRPLVSNDGSIIWLISEVSFEEPDVLFVFSSVSLSSELDSLRKRPRFDKLEPCFDRDSSILPKGSGVFFNTLKLGVISVKVVLKTCFSVVAGFWVLDSSGSNVGSSFLLIKLLKNESNSVLSNWKLVVGPEISSSWTFWLVTPSSISESLMKVLGTSIFLFSASLAALSPNQSAAVVIFLCFFGELTFAAAFADFLVSFRFEADASLAFFWGSGFLAETTTWLEGWVALSNDCLLVLGMSSKDSLKNDTSGWNTEGLLNVSISAKLWSLVFITVSFCKVKSSSKIPPRLACSFNVFTSRRNINRSSIRSCFSPFKKWGK